MSQEELKITQDGEAKFYSAISAKETRSSKENASKQKLLTCKNVKILLSVLYGDLFIGSCYSLMAPFYPAEAENKNASATAYGFVFGIYPFIMFVSAPVYGKLLKVWKPIFLMKIGIFVSGCCNILFGFLHHTPSGSYFIAFSLTIRSLDALGASAFITASFALLASELSDVIGKALSITETGYSLGLAVGPAIGGFLYELQGFSLPFCVVGSLLLCGTFVIICISSESETSLQSESVNSWKILANFDFMLDIIVNASAFLLIGFNEATLEPHIRRFDLSPSLTGGIFLISGLTDAISSPFWGYFIDKMENSQYLIFLANVMLLACFLIVGPVPFLNLPTFLWVVIFSQFLLGLGMAGVVVGAFTHGIKDTINRGFSNDVGTLGVVSALLFASTCFGAFIGPSIGGALVDHVGYKNSTTVMFILQFLVTFLIILRLSMPYCKNIKLSKHIREEEIKEIKH